MIRDCSIELQGKEIDISFSWRKGGEDLVLFIHGLGCDGTYYNGALKSPRLTGYSILVPDLPGHGSSRGPEDMDYTIDIHSMVLEKLLGLKKFRQLHIVGHSMGGAVALLLINRIGSRCSTFINIEGNLIPSDSTASRRAVRVPEDVFIRTVLPDMLDAMEHAADRGTRTWAESVRRTVPRAFYRSSKSLRDWSDSGKLLEMYRNLSCRRCYVYGEYSPARIVLEHIPGDTAIMIPGSGHFPMIDNPGETYDAIGQFLRGVV